MFLRVAVRLKLGIVLPLLLILSLDGLDLCLTLIIEAVDGHLYVLNPGEDI